MERSIWTYKSNSARALTEINESQLKPSGRFYQDLQNMCQLFNVSLHPSFQERISQDSEQPCFIANSTLFDIFSFKLLCIALSSCPTRMAKFSGCALTPEHIDLLIPSLSQEHFQWLQIDWNPLPESKSCELLREGSKIQVLSLRISQLSDDGFRLICENLKNNKYLKTLDLFGNHISNLAPFAEALDVNRFLNNLNVGKNCISDQSLSGLVGSFGKLEFPEEKVEEYRKKEKEAAKLKLQKNRGKVAEPEAPADELVQDEETKQFFLLKNKVFRNLNLSFNQISSGDSLKLMLAHCLPNFKVCVAYCNLQNEFLENLQQTFPNAIIS